MVCGSVSPTATDVVFFLGFAFGGRGLVERLKVLLDRDGRVISCHLPEGNGALIAKAPAMADLLCDLLAGAPVEQLRPRAAAILRQIEHYRTREPGEDDE